MMYTVRILTWAVAAVTDLISKLRTGFIWEWWSSRFSNGTLVDIHGNGCDSLDLGMVVDVFGTDCDSLDVGVVVGVNVSIVTHVSPT